MNTDGKIIEAWRWLNSDFPRMDRELLEKINELVSEYHRKKNVILSCIIIPKNQSGVEKWENVRQEHLPIFTGEYEVEESEPSAPIDICHEESPAPTIPTWNFRLVGKDDDSKAPVWIIGEKGSGRVFPYSKLRGLERAHFLLKRYTARKDPIRIENMEEPAKNRSSILRSWELALRRLRAAAEGCSELEEVVVHLEKHVHFGVWCYYDPGQAEVNWILE